MIGRVAVVSDFSLATLGGAETAYREQVKALAQQVEVVAICPPSAELDALGERSGVTARPVPVWFRVPQIGFPVTRNSPALRRAIGAVLDEFPVDVIHLHSEFAIGAATHDVARERGIPVVQTVHCWLLTHWPIQRLLALTAPPFHRFVTGRPTPKARLADKPGDSAMRGMTVAVARDAARIVAPSSHIGADLAAAGLGPVDVIPNALSAIPPADVLTDVEGPLRVFWFGRCVGEKRLLPFVHSVLAAVDRLGPGRLQVEIAGDGEHLARARTLAAGCPDIRFHGRVPHERIEELLRTCHVTALTSDGFDNQPMMVVEALMALRGVIFCDRRLREGLRTGAGIPAFGGEDELTRVLCELADDPSRVVAASRAAIDARNEFSAATFVARALESYRLAGESWLNSPESHARNSVSNGKNGLTRVKGTVR